jgi:dolichyl-phosphate beta-glucosyltransferase
MQHDDRPDPRPDDGAAPMTPRPIGPGSRRVALSIIVPAYNESARIGAGFERLRHAAATGAVDLERTEVIVVDDGSTDGTREAALAVTDPLPSSLVLRHDRNLGKGAAVRTGVAHAHGEMVAYMDADMAINPEHISDLLDRLRTADIAVGSRTLPGAAVDHPSLRRTAMGRIFNGIVNLTTDVKLGDTQCGFKAFRGPVARLLFHASVINRYAFDVEILHNARRLGFSIAEVPVHWRHVHGSRIRPVADPAAMLADVLRSRSAFRRAPGVPIVDLSDAPDVGVILRAVGNPTIPVIEVGKGHVQILLPLLGSDAQDAVVAVLAAAAPGASMHRLTVPLAQLREEARLDAMVDVPPTETGAPTIARPTPPAGSPAPGTRLATGT